MTDLPEEVSYGKDWSLFIKELRLGGYTTRQHSFNPGTHQVFIYEPNGDFVGSYKAGSKGWIRKKKKST